MPEEQSRTALESVYHAYVLDMYIRTMLEYCDKFDTVATKFLSDDALGGE